MSYADQIYKENCRKILSLGTVVSEKKSPDKWKGNGKNASYKVIYNLVNTYDVSKEFPMLTISEQSLHLAIEELLWTWSSFSSNIMDIHIPKYDHLADEYGYLGCTPGYILGQKHDFYVGGNNEYLNQVERVLYLLKYDSSNRNIVTSTYDPALFQGMALQPQVFSTKWYVEGNKLNLIIHQNCLDVYNDNGLQVNAYAALLCMFATVSNCDVGNLIHVIDEAIIHDRNVKTVNDLMSAKEYDAPSVTYKERICFFDYVAYDFTVTGYHYAYTHSLIPELV